jgi:CRISPR-associated endonuclease/helicase Cas3
LNYDEFFEKATENKPFPWQRELALSNVLRSRIDIPTGLGKTAAVVLAWFWRRRFAAEEVRGETPRRLVYCLPMRVLVEQTLDSVILWLHRLDLLGGTVDIDSSEEGIERIAAYKPSWDDPERIVVSVFMGGETDDNWDLYPERDAVLIGTQDMLLSRALNRGYGMSRYRWPMHFGLLNDDCLWAVDEVQLMGSGLATTTQMQALRRKLGTQHAVKTLWLSATMEPDWLNTIDVDLEQDARGSLSLGLRDQATDEVRKRLNAAKSLAPASARMDDPKALASEIATAHRPGTRTLVVVNTVQRAQSLYKELKSALRTSSSSVRLVLVHSRFRPPDRARAVELLLENPSEAGVIAVSTQVIEAGVDVSSATLFTELAPWASLVQRFGRCNRSGELRDAVVRWIDLPADEKRAQASAAPYDLNNLARAREILSTCKNVAPATLPRVALPFDHGFVLRRRDLVELFDTTPDLMGSDVDVSRFVRDTRETDAQVFWRDLPEGGPIAEEPPPDQDELCPAPLSELRKLVAKIPMWIWDALDEEWRLVTASTPLHPGLAIMLRSASGRYIPVEGWNATRSKPAAPFVPFQEVTHDERYGGDPTAERQWELLAAHTDEVVAETARLANACDIASPLRETLLDSARWHDAGKAHQVFQTSMRGDLPPDEVPDGLLAKSKLRRIRHARRGFRHELASGLIALAHGKSNLVAYLAAAHHGKVRLSLRSLPTEDRPPESERRFARGVWDGETLPDGHANEIDLGGGVLIPSTRLDLSYMELGVSSATGPSWLERMLALRDDPELGPFRLALLEALIKAADERASGGAA